MPLYEYECGSGHQFEEYHTMDNRHDAFCPVCDGPARLRISRPSIRSAEPITLLQELPGGRGYQVLDWKADSGISPKPGQPYKTAKEVQREEHGGIKEI